MASKNREHGSVRRSYLRRKAGLVGRRGATELSRSAGLAPRAVVDQLERRQLLFSLSVTQDLINPATGIGLARAFVAYNVQPGVQLDDIQDPQPPTTRTEDFNDEGYGLIGSGGFFTESGIRVFHNITPAGNFVVSADPEIADNQERYVRAALANGQFFRFQLFNEGDNPTTPITATAVSFTIAPNGQFDATGLEVDRIRVTLRFRDQVIAAFTGQQLVAAGLTAQGTGTLTLNAPAALSFDSVQVEAIGAPAQGVNPFFRLDNLTFTIPTSRFASSHADNNFGFMVTLAGPVGATASFFDLYGRPMVRTLGTGVPQGASVALIDLDDNGVPEFNDGIGSIVLTGTDSRTAFSIIGGTVRAADEQSDDSEFFEGGFEFFLPTALGGFMDDFETAGFGYTYIVQNGEIDVGGLPGGPGSVIIGSPWVRPITSAAAYNPLGSAPGVGAEILVDGGAIDYSNPSQGIFLDGGGSIGSVYVHGILHGSSRFSGFVDQMSVGYLVGNVSVAGDLGSLTVGSDSGAFGVDSGDNPQTTTQRFFRTNGQIIVGRTLGEYAVGGRNAANITVTGDVNNPVTRPARDVFTYYEREYVYGINPAVQDGVRATIRALVSNTDDVMSRQSNALFRPAGQAPMFGNAFIRNDQLLSAEFVGSASAGVRIIGDLSGRDPTQGEDASDVFAFAVDGTQDVILEGTGNIGYARVMNQDGVTLAAPAFRVGTDRALNQKVRFTPDGPGVYYLVVTDGGGADNGFAPGGYTVTMTGLAPVTVGALRSGAGWGRGGVGGATNILAGDLGAVRVGTGAATNSGADGTTLDAVNTGQGESQDDALSFQNGTFSVPGTLYSIITGGDIGVPAGSTDGASQVVFTIGGNLGTLHTGRSGVIGRGPNEGDLNFITLNVGGSIGEIDVQGGIGMDQDNPNDPRAIIGTNATLINTGLGGGRGDIGVLRTGFHVGGDAMRIRQSPGSTFGALLVSQGSLAVYTDDNIRSGIYQGLFGIGLTTGLASDVRFVDFPQLDRTNTVDSFFPLVAGETLQRVDDSGSTLSISVSGGPGVGVLGQVRQLDIDGSQGGAIASIIVDLSGGATLNLSAAGNAGAVGIGRIVITGSDALSSVVISGNVEVDVYQLQAGGVLASITNSTPGGDLVAVDVGGLTDLLISSGNLGRTQVASWGPRLIGPVRGVQAGLQGGLEGPLGFANGGGILDNDFNGTTLRPVNNENFASGNAFLDDIGSPMDDTLNGLVVRAGDVNSVFVSGAIGDVILQGDAATLTSVRANSDRLTPVGQFHGIVGSIYAADILEVDVGDGLTSLGNSPFARAGIFAGDDITRVVSVLGGGLRGAIAAGNLTPAIREEGETQGVGVVSVDTGDMIGASVTARTLDDFWSSFVYGDDNRSLGDVGTITVSRGNMFRSSVRGDRIVNIDIPNGFFDASQVSSTNDVENVRILGSRNSTLSGSSLELSENIISAARNVGTVAATRDLADLTIDVNGSIVGGVSARNIVRTTFDVDNSIASLTARDAFRATSVSAGFVQSITATNAIESSSFAISGPIETISGGARIANTRIEATGQNARIRSITARDLISGSIIAAGPIDSVVVSQGDLDASVFTVLPPGGALLGSGVGTLQAGRDLIVRGEIDGNLSRLVAGRHIGARDEKAAIVVRGDLAQATASAGQLYADLRVGGAVTGTVSIAPVASRPGNDQLGTGSIVAFGRIAGVSVGGDFAGDIISYSGGIGSVTITNGSFLPGRTIAAYSASLASLTITNGNLYGNVHADVDLTAVRVNAGSDGVFGDIGVNPAFSQFALYDALRNQLPVGVAPTVGIDGPRITAGRTIVSLSTSNGSMFEATVHAGRSVQSVAIAGDVRNDTLTGGQVTAIAAGDAIENVSVTGTLRDAGFFAGLVSFGADNRPGGVGDNADDVKSGVIGRVASTGQALNTNFYAGIRPGLDGGYGSADDRQAPGLSSVSTLALGSVSNVAVTADALSPSVAGDARLVKLTTLGVDDALVDSGAGTPGTAFTGTRTFTFGGGTVTLAFGGAGQAFFDAALGRVTLRNTTSGSSLAVTSSLASLTSFTIVTNDDASLGTLRVAPSLLGASSVVIDGSLGTGDFGVVAGTGRVSVGGDVGVLTFAALTGGFVSTRALATLTIAGDYGSTNSGVFNEVNIQALSGGTFNFRGAMRGTVSVDRALTSLVGTSIERAAIRAQSIGTLSASTIRQTVIAGADSIGTVSVTGEVFDSSIIAGVDLGRDAAFGGSGAGADRVTTGTITSVTVGGNFRESDVIAGFYRGPDGFFGTADDTVAPGLGSIGTVSIAGREVGSTRFSETYRVASSGTIGSVRVGGSPMSGTVGNFGVETQRGRLAPTSIQVRDIRFVSNAGTYAAQIQFNQPVDASTIGPALSVSEVRGAGDITIRLIEGVDYTVSYLSDGASSHVATVSFARAVTTANLPQVPGRPGPGVYRFEFDQAVLRGKSLGATVDGNADGFSTLGDDYREQSIVGDAGDKLVAERVAAGAGATATTVDFYAPANLNFVFDNRANPDGLPDVNKVFTIRGVIGDHADHDANNFRVASDVDLYTITLQAGQIIRLSGLQGAARSTGLSILDFNGVVLRSVNPEITLGQFGQALGQVTAVELPSEPVIGINETFPQTFLIKETGTFTIVVGNGSSYDAPGVIENIDPAPGTVGEYSFTVEIYDDLDSGFTSATGSGDGAVVVSAPELSAFAGIDGILGTGDDLTTFSTAGFTFTRTPGTDGVLGTADDVVGGSNASGITSTRTGSRLVSEIQAAIGRPGFAGVPTVTTADVDVFHLNNRQPIAPGSRMKITVKLAQTGSDLGSTSTVGRRVEEGLFPQDRRGAVQFAIFDTSDSTGTDDALLVFAPTDFSPNGGTPNTVIADNGTNRYGFDANGDFYIDFVVPERSGLPGVAGTFAAYVQGVLNSDYKLEIVQEGTGVVARTRQNVFIETGGGTINWLEAGGVTTTLQAFDARTLGFQGQVIDNQPADAYILSNLTASLNALFAGALGPSAGFDVRFSTNPADFENQPFSTVFLTRTSDPISVLFNSFDFGFLAPGQNDPFTFGTETFGASEHSDPFNVDLEDEAFVAVPSFGLLGYTPSRQGVDNFVQSLTAAVSRRAGELMGLRMSTANTALAGQFDFQASNSVGGIPGPGRAYSFPTAGRDLSSPFDSIADTDFFLGRQDSRSILDRVLGRI